MDELTQSLEAFGPWDWACIGANLTAAALGLFGLRCWRGMPGVLPPLPVSASNAALGVVCVLSQGNAAVVQRLDHGLDAGRKIGIATFEVRVLAALERRAKAFLGLDQGSAYLFACV